MYINIYKNLFIFFHVDFFTWRNIGKKKRKRMIYNKKFISILKAIIRKN